jgi:hypothetical protein
MFGEGKSLLAAAIATLLIGSNANATPQSRPDVGQASFRVGGSISVADLVAMRDSSNGSLLAFGQLESISRDDSRIYVLGQELQVLAGTPAVEALAALAPGQTVAVFGEITPDGVFVWSAAQMGNYVPGASPVYLSGEISRVDRDLGLAWIGAVPISYVEPAAWTGFQAPAVGEIVEVFGTQPLPGGALLAEALKVRAASMGTGKSNAGASVGTGRSSAGASVGTGKSSAGASVGTGRSSAGASVGTGKSSAGASVGTGKSSAGASVGTGRSSAGASVGTGRSEN